MPGLTAITSRLNGHGLTIYALVLGCLLLGPWNPAAITDFGLARGALREGEYWRFLTGPLVHTGWNHLAINVAGLVLLQQLFGKELRPVAWCWAYVVTSVVIGICLLAFSRFGSVYGLSGVLHGLFAFAACLALRRDALLAAGALLLLVAKLGWEQIYGGSSFVERLINLPVATDVHLDGAAAGAVLGAVMASSGRAGDG